MRVRYEIIAEVEASGHAGPLHIKETIERVFDEAKPILTGHAITIGRVRIASIYTVAPNDQRTVVQRVPGVDQSRGVEEIKDPRIT